jgi:hypothetical protein
MTIPNEASMFRHGMTLLVAATALSNMASVASAESAFDGRWSVVIQTDKGSCDPAYRYGFAVTNGVVTYAGDSSFEVSGRVAQSGMVHVKVSYGHQYADGTGRLSRDSGTGVWRGAGSAGACSGRWSADRRG